MALELKKILSILNYTTTILATEYNEVCTTLVDVADCECFPNGILKCWIKMNGSTDTIAIRVYDMVAESALGSLTGIDSDGIKEVSFTVPSVDTVLVVEAKKETDNSGDIDIKAGYLIYNP